MRILTGAALAAALLLTGCGTQADPFQDDEADAQAEALEVAWQACEVWGDWPDDIEVYSEEWYHERAISAWQAGGLASQAAYLDPRWRTLADALSYVEKRNSLRSSDEKYQQEGDGRRLREALRDQAALWEQYEWAANNECTAIDVLLGYEQNYYEEYFVDRESDTDGS